MYAISLNVGVTWRTERDKARKQVVEQSARIDELTRLLKYAEDERDEAQFRSRETAAFFLSFNE